MTFAQAKDKARQARNEVNRGVDPILQREAAISQLRAQQISEKTFEQAATAYIEAHGETWRNPKHRAQWTATLATYAFPVMGKLNVRDIGQEHVLTVLEPIWKTKNETASRVRGRIESVLDWATVRKYRTGENPARWKGHLDHLLPAPNKVKKVTHHRALPIDDMPAFMRDLKSRDGTAARALEFTILTAARSGEVRGATWSEVDLNERVWTVPAERMKAHREHRVPLSDAAVTLLKAQKPEDGKARKPEDLSILIFPAPRGGLLSDMALTAVMRRIGADAVPHGFRSTFRDWAGERTDFPREVAEQALAHTLESKVEAAYRRGDSLDKRRKLMSDWAEFCSGTKALSVADIFRSRP